MSIYPFIRGEPPTFLTKNEKAWKVTISTVCSHTLKNPHLKFIVSSWQRNYNYFDLDNLSKPVLDVVGKGASTVWVSMQLGQPAGVHISEEISLSSLNLYEEHLYIANPPTRSIRASAPLPELQGRCILGSNEPLGLKLQFDSNTARIGDFGFEGPIKPLIDSLGPLLGTYHQGAVGYRIHEIHISRGYEPSRNGVYTGLRFLSPKA